MSTTFSGKKKKKKIKATLVSDSTHSASHICV